MIYVTTAQMKAIDRNAIEKYGVPAALLMENAGAAVAGEILKSLRPCKTLVVSGYGNNGGDGFVVARHLLNKGYDVSVFLAGRPKPFSKETGDNFATLLSMGNSPRSIYDIRGTEMAFKAVGRCGLIVDALFGIGIKGRLDDFYTSVINRINSLKACVFSVDVPSGMDADEGIPCPVAVRAAITVTFGFAKKGFKNPASEEFTGKVIVADIGIPEAAAREIIG
ncbi:MAG: NAD(P)H-hydrate epimerase [Candidatus Omnitrophica bacterium]|nr:NAD(P)H-hydrate epimerase [Candidatus Omnitrophota bacterium]MCM8791307.1 NAD(P)H-hydrate epimerase [Candidatus Omnitrophota bacterium]